MAMTADQRMDLYLELLQLERIIATRMFFDNKNRMKESNTTMWTCEQSAKQRASVLEGLIVKNGGTVPPDMTRQYY